MQPFFARKITCNSYLSAALDCLKRTNDILGKNSEVGSDEDINSLNTNKKGFFTNFDLAVLGGEFYSEHKAVFCQIEEQNHIFQKLAEEIKEEEYPNLFSAIQHCDVFNKAILVYKDLLDYKSGTHPDKLSLDNKIFFFSHKANTLKSIDTLISNEKASTDTGLEGATWFSLFNINVLLAIQEATLRCEPKNLRNLREIELLLKRQEYKSYSSLNVLKEKAQYLSFKTKIRLSNGAISDEDLYRLDNSDFYYFKEFYDETLKFWVNKDFVFDITSNQAEIVARKSSLLIKEPSPPFSAYHFLNKYCKLKAQKTEDETKLKEIISELQSAKDKLRQTQIQETEFSGYSCCTVINLLNSTILSVSNSIRLIKINSLEKIRDKDVVEYVSSVKGEYDTFYTFQEKHKIYNYCLSKHALIAIEKLLERLASDNLRHSLNISMKTVEEIIGVIDDIDIERAYQWEKRNYHLPVYLSFEDCIKIVSPKVYTEQEEGTVKMFKTVETYSQEDVAMIPNVKPPIKIFLDSSYIIPVNYENIEQDISKIKRAIEKNKTILIEKVLNVASEKAIAEFASQKDELERSFRSKTVTLETAHRDSIKQYISTLGIFASIITYVLGGIKLATDTATTLHEKAVLLFLLGIGLMSFLVAIEYVIVKRQSKDDNEKQNSHYWFLLAIVLIDITIFTMLRNGWFEPEYNKTIHRFRHSKTSISNIDTLTTVKDSTKVNIQN